jgi:ligand-binding sensor domain-containing protein
VTIDPRAAHATAVTVDPSDSGVVYVGSSAGVFVSHDGGGAWDLKARGMSDTRVFALAVNPRSPHTVYAGGFGGRFYRSTDRGATWVETRIGSVVYRLTSLAVDAGDSSIPALDNRPTAVYAGTSGGGLLRSDDGGATWRALEGLSERIVYAIALDPRIPSTVYVGTPAGVYRSLDRGMNWVLTGPEPSTPVLCLAVDPERPATVLAGTPDGVMVTSDGGRAWRRTEGVTASGAVVSVVLDPWNPKAVYTATFGGRVLGGSAR